MHWYTARLIAQSRDRQLEHDAATRRRIREGAAAPAPALDIRDAQCDPCDVSLPPAGTPSSRPAPRSRAA